MNWKRLFVRITCVSVFFTVPFVSARTQEDNKTACFVVLEGPSVLMEQRRLSGGASIKSPRFTAKRTQIKRYEETLAERQTEVARQIQALDKNARIRHQYQRLVNALEVEIDSSQWQSLREIPGISYIAPVQRMKPFLTDSGDLMNLPLALENIDAVDHAGEGVFIAIIDTGIDITHPALSAEGYAYPEGFPKGDADFTTGKVIAARVFPPSSGSAGDKTLFDRQGHGTNVSTIAAGNAGVSSPLGVLSGVASRAYLGNYKVFTSDYTENGQVIRAIESAVDDGADVINLSLGSDTMGDPQHDLQILAVKNAVDLGVVVVIAAGNAGNEDFTIGNPAQTEDAISVGSITNSHVSNGNPAAFDVYVTAFKDGEPLVEDVPAAFSANAGPLTDPIIGTFQIQDVDLLDGGEYGGSTDGLACEPFQADSPLDWVLVQRGDCTFTSKVENVQNAGGKGVIFFDNNDELSLDQPLAEGSYLPSMLIDKQSGLLIKEALLDGSLVVVSIEGDPITDRNLTPNQLSTYSASGPTINYAMKPDIVTVGEGSFAGTQNDDANESTFNASGFQWLSGTSMAAPRIAGLAAILCQQHPEWPPAWIKSALAISSRNPVMKKNRDTATVLESGSGIVDAAAAVDVDTIVVPASINFGVHMILEDVPERWITIVNTSGEDASYTLLPGDASNSHGITLSEERFDLKPGEKKEILVTLPSLLDLPEGDNEGEILLTNISTDHTYRLPYWTRIHIVPLPYGSVLLVDDDGGGSFEEYYMDRLDELGIEYTWWDVHSMDYPVLDYLSQFKTILWFMSDTTLNSISDENSIAYVRVYNPRLMYQLELMKYLVSGGTLFLSAQDYSDDQQVSAFSQEILAVNLRDQENSASTVQGYTGSPVFDGIGPFSVTYPQDFENWIDYLTPLDNSRVKRAFIGDGNRAKTVGVTIEDCSYRVVFLSFPLEVLDPAAGLSVLQKSLDWLNENSSEGIPGVNAVTPSEIDLTTMTGPFSVSIDGAGFAFKSGYRAYLDFIPVSELEREGCNTLTGTLPSSIQPGEYTLRLITGDGHEIRLEKALTVVDGTGTTGIMDWALF